jgi:beta-glucosidase-like glycosyl hydrolase
MIVEYFMPVFKTCVQEAKVKSIMCSYNAVNGIPSCANSKFQNEIVRDQWGWDGYIVSDCGAIGDIEDPHHYTADPLDTVAAALKGGTDMECDNVYQSHAAEALNVGKITIEDVEQAISRHGALPSQTTPTPYQPLQR